MLNRIFGVEREWSFLFELDSEILNSFEKLSNFFFQTFSFFLLELQDIRFNLNHLLENFSELCLNLVDCSHVIIQLLPVAFFIVVFFATVVLKIAVFLEQVDHFASEREVFLELRID